MESSITDCARLSIDMILSDGVTGSEEHVPVFILWGKTGDKSTSTTAEPLRSQQGAL